MSLKEKAVSGVKWQVINKVTQKLLSVATFAVLARILDPKAFGTFAMAFIAIDALQFFKSFGLDSALIQKKETDANFETAKNTAFLLIQSTGVLLCTVAFIIAVPVSHFFNKPSLSPIIQVLGIVFVLTCLSKVPQTLMTKHMQFNKLAFIEFIGSMINSVFAICIAFFTKSVWALVIAYIMKQTVITMLSWYWSGFRFKWEFDKAAARELMGYGRFLVGVGIVWFLQGNINNIVVGKMLGATMLGYFAVAGNVANFINTHFVSLISTTLMPAYAKIQQDRSEVKRVYLKTIRFVAMITLPFSVFLIFLAPEFVRTLYGEKWELIIPLVRLFGVVQLIAPIVWCNGPVFLGCGKPKYIFNLSLASVLVRTPLLIAFAYWWGLKGVILSNLATTLVFAPINAILVQRFLGFSHRDFFRQLGSSFFCAALMAAFLIIIKYLAHTNGSGISVSPVIQFASLACIGACVYAVFYFYKDKETFVELQQLILRRKKSMSVPA